MFFEIVVGLGGLEACQRCAILCESSAAYVEVGGDGGVLCNFDDGVGALQDASVRAGYEANTTILAMSRGVSMPRGSIPDAPFCVEQPPGEAIWACP